MKIYLIVSLAMGLLLGCKGKPSAEKQPFAKKTTADENLEQLKEVAANGDLVVRLGDDLLSYQIKFLNEKDQSYSHAGLIVEQNGRKIVAHIAPDDLGKDVVQYIPIDSFFNPSKNISGALYRFDLSPAELDSLTAIIDRF